MSVNLRTALSSYAASLDLTATVKVAFGGLFSFDTDQRLLSCASGSRIGVKGEDESWASIKPPYLTLTCKSPESFFRAIVVWNFLSLIFMEKSVTHSKSDDHTPPTSACDQCRARKIRCNRQQPSCRNCVKVASECTFSGRPKRVNHTRKL